jgi:hypothetical protein
MKYYQIKIDNLNIQFQEENDGFYHQLNQFFKRLQSAYGEDIQILDIRELDKNEH